MANESSVVTISVQDCEQVGGGLWKKNGVIPGYVAPTVIYDDGINVQTTSPSSTNVVTNYV